MNHIRWTVHYKSRVTLKAFKRIQNFRSKGNWLPCPPDYILYISIRPVRGYGLWHYIKKLHSGANG